MRGRKVFPYEGAEFCVHWKDVLEEMQPGESRVVILAVPESVPGHFWCLQLGMPGERGDCGSICEHYKPRNGKNGCCSHRGQLYKYGERITLNA